MKTWMKFGIAAILMVAMLAVPAMACPPTCPDGYVWGPTGSHQECEWVWVHGHTVQDCGDHYGFDNQGQCVNYCKDPDHCDEFPYPGKPNCCSSNSGTRADRCAATCQNYGCHNHYVPGHFERQCHTVIDYGCIPDGSCPVTPCNEGYECFNNECVPVCPENSERDEQGVCQCDAGYHAEEQPYDVFDVFTIQRETNGNGFVCVKDRAQSYYSPWTNSYWNSVPSQGGCEYILGKPVDAALDVVDDQKIFVKVEYQSMTDGVVVKGLASDNEAMYDGLCTERYYYTSNCVGERLSGGGIIVVPIQGESRALEVIAIKDETSTPQAFQLMISILDSKGNVLFTDSTTGDQMVYDKVFSIKSDMSGCRVDNHKQGWHVPASMQGFRPYPF